MTAVPKPQNPQPAQAPSAVNAPEGHSSVVLPTEFPLTSVLLKSFGITVTSVGVIWGLIELSSHIFSIKLLAGSGLLGAVLIAMVSGAVGSTYLVAKLYQHVRTSRFQIQQIQSFALESGRRSKEDEFLTDTIMIELQDAYRHERWEEVIKIGSVLSRPLWVTGKCSLRVSVGKLVESAAAFSEHRREQATALIDDLGWTNVLMKHYTEAKSNILHGIEIAEEIGAWDLAHKGYRHLSGIALEDGDLPEAERFYGAARKIIEQASEGGSTEIRAGLHVNRALIDQQKGDFAGALEQLRAAQRIYNESGDRDREVKLFHFMGDVLLRMGRLGAAKDAFREGLALSKRHSRKDGVLNNNLGLATIADAANEHSDAAHYYLEAASAARDLGQQQRARELESKAAACRAAGGKINVNLLGGRANA